MRGGRGCWDLLLVLFGCDFGGMFEREEGSIVYLAPGHTHYIWFDLGSEG